MYPAAIPTFTTPDPNKTLDQDNHTARHALEDTSIVALATKVGIDSSADTTSHDFKLSGVATGDKAASLTGSETMTNKTLTSPTLNGSISGSSIKDEDDMASNSNTHLATQQSIKAYVDASIASAVAAAKQALYPVGSLYANKTSTTNPATLLGFGTWAAVENRVIVGKGSGTFATLGATGGAETHTLTIAEMPSHTHGQKVTANSGSAIRKDYSADGGFAEYDQGVQTYASGGGGSHNNLQPYVVACVWERTA